MKRRPSGRWLSGSSCIVPKIENLFYWRLVCWEGSIPNVPRPILIHARALELFHAFRRLSASLFPELLFAQQNMTILFSVWQYEMPNTLIVALNIISLCD